MARIFLSYAREDAVKAASLAKALERSGHTLWWDRHVEGGTRFAREIAAALKDAEVIVVLWSRHSVESEWVQDEAAEGRDSGRLVPIALDDSPPPLGFRQVQAIDLTRWSGRGKIPSLPAIESAIATVLKGDKLPRAPPPARRAIHRSWPANAAAAVLVLLLIAGSVLYGTGLFPARANEAVLAVLPFTDLSPTRDKDYFAEGVAEEIRALLAEEPGLQVTGSTSTRMLAKNADLDEARRRLGVSHLVEGSVRVQGPQIRVNVRLVRTRDGAQLWSQQFRRKLQDVFAIQDEVAARVASQVRTRFWAAAPATAPRKAHRTSNAVYDLYLAAGSKARVLQVEPLTQAQQMLLRAVELDPKYAPAWARLGLVTQFVDWNGPPRPPEDSRAIYEQARGYIKRALALDPGLAEGWAALGMIEQVENNPEQVLARTRRALELDPNNHMALVASAIGLNQLCRATEAADAWARAVTVEPLLEESNWQRITFLAGIGRHRQAEAAMRDFLARSREPRLSEELPAIISVDRGDLSSAIVHGLRRVRMKPERGDVNEHLAYALHALGAVDRAVAALPSDLRPSRGAYWKGDYVTAARGGQSLESNLALLRLDRERELVAGYGERVGTLRKLDARQRCRLPFHAPALALALHRLGRHQTAERLLTLAERRQREALDAGYRAGGRYVISAKLAILRGDRAAAIAHLETAMRAGWINQWGDELAEPFFDPIRSDPRFAAIVRRTDAALAREKRELAAAGVRVA